MPYRPIVVIEAGLGRTVEMSIEPCKNLWYLRDARVAGLTGFVQLVGQVSLGYLVNKPNEDKTHDDVIKWKHFPRNWPFVREIHRSPVNFPHKGQWRGALMFSLIYAWINDWVNNREAGDLRRQHGHYDVIVMVQSGAITPSAGWHYWNAPESVKHGRFK